jgi:hypothetical protein
LDEKVGLALADWASGGAKQTAAEKKKIASAAAELEEQLLALAETLDKKPQIGEAIDRSRSNPDGFHEWLKRQVELAREAVSQKEDV